MSSARQLAVLWGGVALVCLAGLLLTPRLAPDLLSGVTADLPACPVKKAIGLPCPTCGATRSALAPSELELGEALALNPLLTIAWLVFVAGGLGAGGLAIAGARLPELPRRLPVALRWAAVGVVAVNWLFLLHRGV